MIYDQLNTERIATLHPTVQKMARQWLGKLQTAGREVLITSGYRTKAQQDALYALGRTKPGKIVTNAQGGQSLHQYRVALDFTPVDAKGNALYGDRKRFEVYAKVAKLCGFEWGGDFPKFPDIDHLQYTGGLTLKDFQSGKTLP